MLQHPKIEKKTLAGILRFFGRFWATFSSEKSDLDLCEKKKKKKI